jgi:hypothetical protein
MVLEMQEYILYTFSSVERTKELCVPRALCFLICGVFLVLLRRLRIYEIVCIAVQGLAHDERSFLGWGQLVHVGCALDPAENEISLAESHRFDLPAVVAAEALLVRSRPREGQVACFFQQVDAVFMSLFGFGFSVLLNPWRIVLEVHR